MQPVNDPPRVDEQGRLLCHATTRDGEPCKSPCVTGMKVCRMHGGSSPQAKRKARLRLAELVDPAIATLARIMVDQTAKESDRIRAADSVLDRAGWGRSTSVEVADAKEVLVERLRELREAADEEMSAGEEGEGDE